MNMDQKKEIELKDLLPLMEERFSSGGNVRFSPRGISMLPMLRQGVDCVILSPAPEKLHKYDIPFYRREDGKFILHRVVKVDDTYTCIGDNHFVLEQGVRQDQVIAVVSGFTRGEKEYKVSDLRYQLYCRIWHYSRPVRYFCKRAKGWLRRHF